MKKTVLLSIVLLLSLCGIAQTHSTNSVLEVEVHDLEYQSSQSITLNVFIGNKHRKSQEVVEGKTPDVQHDEMVPEINEMVKSALSKVNRFNCTTQLSEENQGLKVTGVITDISTNSERKVSKSKDKHGNITREVEVKTNGCISLSLTLTDMSDHLFHTHQFTQTDFEKGKFEDPQAVLSSIINTLSYRISGYYNEMYPVQAQILEIAEVKKGKVKKLYLDVGKNDRIEKGQHFDIFHQKSLAGHTTQEKIGRVKVEEVSGFDVCLCKVQKGGTEIKAAVDAQQKLIAIFSK